MKKVIIILALAMGIVTANAQENVTVVTDNGSEQPTLTKEVYPQKEADGDLYHGLTKKLTFDRMVPPHGLEVTYDKTCLLYTSPSPRDISGSRMPSSA